MKSKILVVAAHPDDEVLGAGGTIAARVGRGDEVRLLVFGEGPVSRKASENKAKQECEASCKILGIQKTYFESFPDQLFETKPILDFARKLEEILKEYAPDTLFTHHYSDLNRDHRIVSEAVMVATRAVPGQTVKEVLFWENLSSSEWTGFHPRFQPQVFQDISKTLDKKMKAMEAYQTEVRDYPHPRSVRGLEALARYRGIQSGCEAAESFEVFRILRMS